MSDGTYPLASEIAAHYDGSREQDRLERGAGLLELLRSQDLLERVLPASPATVLDVGGGPGRYAFWLAARGDTVHLVDALPHHVQIARDTAAACAGPGPASITVGDARDLAAEDESVDAVLLMGPLYHLTSRDDRVTALRECRRVLAPGGVVVAACISRYASALGGLFEGMLDDEDFAAIVDRDLTDGQHRNPAENPHWFTTAYFHAPEQLRDELGDAGLVCESLIGVEGPAWLLPDLDARLADPSRRAQLLGILRRLETEPSLLGASAHVLAIGRKR